MSCTRCHLVLFQKTLGPFPESVSIRGEGEYVEHYFNERGEFIIDIPPEHCSDLQFIISQYGIEDEEAALLADFLAPMLALDPAERIKASEALKHPWLRIHASDEREARPPEKEEEAIDSSDGEPLYPPAVPTEGEVPPSGELPYPSAQNERDGKEDGGEAVVAVAEEMPDPPKRTIPLEPGAAPIVELGQQGARAELQRSELLARWQLRVSFLPGHLKSVASAATCAAAEMQAFPGPPGLSAIAAIHDSVMDEL